MILRSRLEGILQRQWHCCSAVACGQGEFAAPAGRASCQKGSPPRHPPGEIAVQLTEWSLLPLYYPPPEYLPSQKIPLNEMINVK